MRLTYPQMADNAIEAIQRLMHRYQTDADFIARGIGSPTERDTDKRVLEHMQSRIRELQGAIDLVRTSAR